MQARSTRLPGFSNFADHQLSPRFVNSYTHTTITSSTCNSVPVYHLSLCVTLYSSSQISYRDCLRLNQSARCNFLLSCVTGNCHMDTQTLLSCLLFMLWALQFAALSLVTLESYYIIYGLPQLCLGWPSSVDWMICSSSAG